MQTRAARQDYLPNPAIRRIGQEAYGTEPTNSTDHRTTKPMQGTPMKRKPLNKEQTEALFDAYLALDDKQELTLHNFAAHLLAGSGFSSGTDLLHHVLIRTIEGKRLWPPGVPLGAFFNEAMRSASGVAKRHPDRIPLSYEDGMEVERAPPFFGESEFACTPEEAMIKRQETDHVRGIMDGAKMRLFEDKIASDVLSGLEMDMSPAEIRKAFGIDDRSYKAARARINRDIRANHSPPSC